MSNFIFLIPLSSVFISLSIPILIGEMKNWRRRNYLKIAMKKFPEIKENPDDYRISLDYRNESIKIVKMTTYLKSLYRQEEELKEQLSKFSNELDSSEASIDDSNPFQEELKVTISETKRFLEMAENKIVNYEIDNSNLVRYIDI